MVIVYTFFFIKFDTIMSLSRYIIFLSIITTLFLASCGPDKPQVYPSEPEISIIYTSGDTFHFTDETSVVNIGLYLIDGDKDMGNGDRDSVFKFEEYRSDTLYQTFYLGMANIPRETIDGPTLKATVEFPLRSYLFVPRSDTLHMRTLRDTLYFKIQATDEAGNASNVVVSEPFYIHP